MSSNWCKFNAKYNHRDPNYKKILDFFLWANPAPNTAYGAKVFNDYGWISGNSYKKLKRQLGLKGEIPFVISTVETINNDLKINNQLNSRIFKEILVLIKPSTGEMESVFRVIRNALAHGSFNVSRSNGEYYYSFENRNAKQKDKINARIVLKSTTLLSWIKIVKSGPKE